MSSGHDSNLNMQQIDELLQIGALTPVDKNSVLFIGRAAGRLIDNVKYAFLEACRNDYGFSPLFLTSFSEEYAALRKAGLPVAMFPKDLRKVAAASVVVSDDFWWKSSPVYALLHERKTLQLWHGIPLKSIGFCETASKVNMDEEKGKYLEFMYSGYDTVLSTSGYVSEHIFSRVFKCRHFLDAGYPRNDVLLRKADALDMLGSSPELLGRIRAHKRSGGKVAVYMPTFRDTGGDIFSDGAIDAGRLDRLCKKHNLLLILKFHPYVQLEIGSNFTNFVAMESGLDIYPLLGQADFLITDYSSVYFDFLLLNRPIHFYVYDLEKYVTKDREFMLDFDAVAPGVRSYNQEEFFDSIEQLLSSGDDGFEKSRKELCANLFDYNDSSSAARVCEYIKDNMI